MERFLWICLGGAAGTGARYLLGGWVLHWLGPGFPWGTLAVNVLGSFLLGALMHLGLVVEGFSPALRLTLTTGVMGGFTTYSTFSYETLRQLQVGAYGQALLNVGATVVTCLLACYLGLVLARALAGN
ncbi:MAG: fluoride efflux transporter CrcB [Planctomycetes bacterium]|nr:fluoride efflux transporter CrcB [Planctomycetota bacterium]